MELNTWKDEQVPEKWTFGLLTDLKINDDTNPNFGNIHSFCEELHQAAQALNGEFSIFSIRDVKEELIEAYTFDGERWVKQPQRFPSVIYNRIHSRKFEQSEQYRSFLTLIQSKNIHLFNSRYFSKWEVHQLLLDELTEYLPETKMATLETLQHMLHSYEELFLKPIYGSQGKGIIRVFNNHKHFFASFPDNKNICYENEEQLIIGLKPFFQKQAYIVQQGISCLTDQDRRIDFRVLCHKVNRDEWRITSIVARAAGEYSFLTNIAQGGEILKPILPLMANFQREWAFTLLEFLKELALRTAIVFSKQFDGTLGELGIDIGIDVVGKPWLIEINSKPSKNFEIKHTKIRPSAKAIIEYGKTQISYNKEDSSCDPSDL